MSLALDAIILFAIVLIIWQGANQGFIRALMSLISTIASLLVAYAFTPRVAAWISEKFISDQLTSGIQKVLSDFAKDMNFEMPVYNLDRLTIEPPQGLTDLLERYNINLSGFLDKIRGYTAVGENTVHDVAEGIASPTASLLSTVIAFISLFFVCFIVLALLTSLLDGIFRLPVLRTANTLLGLVFGLAEAVVVALLLSHLLATLVTALGPIKPDLFGAKVVDQTVIVKYIVNLDLATVRHIYDVVK